MTIQALLVERFLLLPMFGGRFAYFHNSMDDILLRELVSPPQYFETCSMKLLCAG